nr:MAG TPA: YjcQ protein [Caudoviricetes sp.]
MASDDFEVIAFKILSYLYRCLKNGKKVYIAALRQLVGCNEAYFGAVVRSIQSKGLVEGFDFDTFSGVLIDPPNIVAMSDPMITMDGAIFVSENSRTRKAKDFAGHAFEVTLSAAIQAAESRI